MDLNLYLNRIKVHSDVSANLAFLQLLHRQHLFNVPFENLDIHCGRKIILREDKFLQKILVEKRGGFCYELNGAFYALLNAAGFNVSMISARVYEKGSEPGPEFDHMALLVKINNDNYLADVGFGDSFIEPLRMSFNEVQQDLSGYYKILPGENCCILSRSKDKNDFIPQYSFTLIPRILSDFDEMCNYHQTSPQSHFTQKIICSMAAGSGRISLARGRYIVTADGVKEQNEITDPEFYSILQSGFGITLKTVLKFP